jgi:hypothetical protein
MRKRAIFACLLAVAMLLSGCGLVEKDLAVDNATVIIELGDKTINKAQINYAVQNELSYQYYYYSMYGQQFDPSDPTVVAQAQDQVIEGLTQQVVKEAKAKELGLDTFTEEEDATIRQKAQESMDTDKESVKSQYFADTTLEGDELDAAIVQKLTDSGRTFDDYYYVSAKADAAQEKLRESVIKDVTVSDQEVQQELDSRIQDAKANYANSLSAYGSAVNAGTTVYYAPPGYRYVKHILRAFPDVTKTALSAIQQQITDKQTQITSLENSITSLGTDVKADDPQLVSLNSDKAAAEQEKADLQAQYDKAQADAAALLQPTVDEILAKLNADGDFDALMAEYGEDPGMKSSPQKETGYAICEGFASFDPAFTEAAMALKAVGDISPATVGQSGIHIIQYTSDIPEGPVALETVKDDLSAELLTTKQDETFNNQVTEWVAQSPVKVYKERMAQ